MRKFKVGDEVIATYHNRTRKGKITFIYNIADNEYDYVIDDDVAVYERELELVEEYKDKSAERFDEVTEEEENKMIMDEAKEKANGYKNPLDKIREKDPEFFEVINSLIGYLASTYGDKYEADSGAIKSKNILLSKEGKAANIFTTIKYIQRYNTSGYKKSNNIEDINKAIHYLLFELQRRRTHE